VRSGRQTSNVGCSRRFCETTAAQRIEFEVVFVSAYDEYTQKANNYNALDYLLKPVDKDALLRTMARIRDL